MSDELFSKILQMYVKKMARLYNDSLEYFLMYLGATEDNIQEYEIRSYPISDTEEIFHNDVLIGRVCTSFDETDGYRFTVECEKL